MPIEETTILDRTDYDPKLSPIELLLEKNGLRHITNQHSARSAGDKKEGWITLEFEVTDEKAFTEFVKQTQTDDLFTKKNNLVNLTTPKWVGVATKKVEWETALHLSYCKTINVIKSRFGIPTDSLG